MLESILVLPEEQHELNKSISDCVHGILVLIYSIT